MAELPNDALVVRGGQNLPKNFVKGSGVAVDDDGKLDQVSVNAGADASLENLTAPNAATGYPGIVHNQVGITTVGEIRAAGGEVEPTPRPNNPYHATLRGLTPQQASNLFQPTQRNPHKSKS